VSVLYVVPVSFWIICSCGGCSIEVWQKSPLGDIRSEEAAGLGYFNIILAYCTKHVSMASENWPSQTSLSQCTIISCWVSHQTKLCPFVPL